MIIRQCRHSPLRGWRHIVFGTSDNRFHEDTFTASQRYLRWLTKVSSTPIEGIFVFLPMFLRVTDIKNPKFFDYSSDIL